MEDTSCKEKDYESVTFISSSPKWEWCIARDWHSMTVHVYTPPTRLGRFFQKWLLDIHWRKIEK